MQIKLNNWRGYYESEHINDRLSIYYTYIDSSISGFSDDVLKGLYSERKYLHPKYFYDTKGSELFEKICSTKEYYVTRTEASILRKYSNEIISCVPNAEALTELGSGASIKTRYLIDSSIELNGSLQYSPIDVSTILIESAQNLISEIPELRISGIISEYESGIELANELYPEPKLIIFLGSSIGNFDLSDAKRFVKFISDNMIDDDNLLIGFDMVKDTNVLNSAYNDRSGYTSKFNLNLLNRINSELKSNFDVNKFEHHAFFNESESRIEMHLESKENQSVRINGSRIPISFKKGETIHTENSYKFTNCMINDIASYAGLKVVNQWTDERKYFSLVLFQKI